MFTPLPPTLPYANIQSWSAASSPSKLIEPQVDSLARRACCPSSHFCIAALSLKPREAPVALLWNASRAYGPDASSGMTVPASMSCARRSAG
eukprot:3669916-Prymnesium_polylepis.1